MTVLLAARPAGHTAVKKQLGSGIPPQALATHYLVWGQNLLLGYQGKLNVTVLFGCTSFGAHCEVKKKLGSGIELQALATDVHITCGVKIYCWVGVIGKCHNNTDTILHMHVKYIVYDVAIIVPGGSCPGNNDHPN